MAKQDKAQKVESAEVLDAEVMQENAVSVANTTGQALKRFNVADAAIDEMLKRTKKIKLANEQDAKGYELVKSAHKEYVSTRTGLDKRRKEINQPFDAVIKNVNAEGKRLTEKFAAEEARLAAERERFESWQKQEEERLAKEAEEKLKTRVQTLKDAGLVFDGDFYTLGDISLDVVTIGKQSDADFDFLVAKVQALKSKLDEAAAEAKRKADEEAENQRKEAERVERERKENRAEKLEMRTEKLEALGFETDSAGEVYNFNKGGRVDTLTFDAAAEMNKADFDAYVETVKGWLEEIQAAAERAEREALFETRKQVLTALDVTVKGGEFYYSDVLITGVEVNQIAYFTAEKWADTLAHVKTQVSEIKAANEAKAAAEKAEQEAKEKAAREERMPDLEKVERYVAAVQEVTIPQMKTEAVTEIMIAFRNAVKLAAETALESVKNLKDA